MTDITHIYGPGTHNLDTPFGFLGYFDWGLFFRPLDTRCPLQQRTGARKSISLMTSTAGEEQLAPIVEFIRDATRVIAAQEDKRLLGRRLC